VRNLLLFLFLAGSFSVAAQDAFYDPGTIHEIRIHFREHTWRHILDSLFKAAGDNGKLTGDVTIDGHFLPGAGIRYKGYSSYNENEIKNPFNIDLDYHIKNQNHLDHVKIKLSNVIHDPSFVREVLSYEIARNYLPSPEAGFANLYVNDTLIGLYTNVEAVDQKFLLKHWGNDQNSFFKGEPLKLQYPFGDNANLALTHGSDSGGYIPYYNMESAAGWNNLYNLISRLDMGADSAAGILNIDRALWMHAFNEALLNLDSYIGYSQNFYLYKDENGRFNPILWDLNMSFGSFRDSDGSTHFLGLTIPEAEKLDPLALMDFAVSPRPLMTKLFSNDTLRRMYYAHMRTIVEEQFRNGRYYARAKELQALIDNDVLNDSNRFYSYDDFHANLTGTVGGTGSMNEYPGIRELVEARMDYLDKLVGFTGQPVISEVTHFPDEPIKNENCWITASVQRSAKVLLGCRFSSGGTFSRISMADDGNHHDGEAGDGVFGARINTGGNTIQYYIYAENDQAGMFSPERAEFDFYTIQPMILPGEVVINEISPGSGEEAWIELLNTTTEPLKVTNMNLTNESSSQERWSLPDTLIFPKKYLLIYPSAISAREKSYAPLTLSPYGGSLVLSSAAGVILDSATYGPRIPGKSTGRYPNGYGPITYMIPTKGAFNTTGTTPRSGFILFPNPGREQTYIEFKKKAGAVMVTIFDSYGKTVLDNAYFYGPGEGEPVVQPLDISLLSSGLYLVRVNVDGETSHQKLIID